MNISRTLSLAALLGLNPFLALAQGDDPMRVWADPGVSVKERAVAVNRAFPNGTPISLIVAKLGTNYTRSTATGALCLVYSFGGESVAIETDAALDAPLLSAKFICAGCSMPPAPPAPMTGIFLFLLAPASLGLLVLLFALCFAKTNRGLWLCGIIGGLLFFCQDLGLRLLVKFSAGWDRGATGDRELLRILGWVDLSAVVSFIAYCILSVLKVKSLLKK
jgi:hypothetical protein